jgi:hypothetical protein
MLKQNYYIATLSYKVAISIIIEKHYLHRQAPCSFAFGLFDKKNDEIVGVVIYGTPSSAPLRMGICGIEEKDNVINGKIQFVIIENKDRLCRFGFELIEQLFKYYGTNIIIANDTIQNKTYEQELTDDLIYIIHYFSMKSYSNRRKLNKIKKELLTD